MSSAFESDLQRLNQARDTGKLSGFDVMIEEARILIQYGLWEGSVVAFVDRDRDWIWDGDEEGRREAIDTIRGFLAKAAQRRARR